MMGPRPGFSKPLPVLLLAYLVLGVLYSIGLPIFEAPDEQQHYAYVHYLATECRLPPWDPASPAGQESSQPPLYYAAAALATTWLDHDPVLALQPNPYYDNYQAPGTVNDNKNAFLHTDAETFPWRGTALTVHIARLVNLLFGSLTIVATYLLARETFGGFPELAISAAALVAFNPQFLFISAAVNNDAAASAFSTLSLWLLVGGLRRGYTPRRAILLGLAVGLAALSKVSVLALLPLAAVALALTLWRTRRWAEMCRAGSVMLSLAVIVTGWWYIHNAVLYGDPFGLKTHFETWWAREEPLSLAQSWAQWSGVERSFWAAFGMGNVRPPGAVYLALWFLVRVSIIGLSVWAVRAWKAGSRPGPRAWSLALLALWFVMVCAALLRWMQLVKAALGRLLFPAIGAFAILLVWGLAQLVPRRYAVWPGAVLAGGLFGVAVLSPSFAITPAYARPPLLTPDDIAARVHSTDVRFGDGIHLVGYQLERDRVRPGEEVVVTLCWEAVAPMAQDYAHFVHLLGPQERIIGARDTYPGLGRFPTSQWEPGDSFCDVVRVPVKEWAPTLTVYGLEVGWYEPGTGERLVARYANSAPVDLVILDHIKVVPEEYLAAVPNRVDADLGGQIKLLGYNVSGRQIAPGETLSLTLYWAAQAPVPANYTVFVHLAAANSLPSVQDDSQPRRGSYPTSFWDVGEVVTDPHTILVPANLPLGEYSLSIGMYLLETGERLPVFDSKGARLPADTIPLVEVTINP